MSQAITVAIQGEKASFHEIAAQRYYQHSIKLIYCQSFEEVFNKLANGVVDKGFVAVSNSNHGEIDEVRRLLIETTPIVEGEYHLPIQQHIIGLPHTDLNNISTVISHPVALSQCSIHIKSYFSGAAILNYHDTSAAVEYVKHLADPSIVAIGSEAAAKLHGLEVLWSAIQDDPDNTTVFQSLIAR